LRLQQEITQQDLAGRAAVIGWEISRDAVKRIESGDREITDIKIKFLSQALRVPPAVFSRKTRFTLDWPSYLIGLRVRKRRADPRWPKPSQKQAIMFRRSWAESLHSAGFRQKHVLIDLAAHTAILQNGPATDKILVPRKK
jgi:transcriptional regulator with XRE-family HTH domain